MRPWLLPTSWPSRARACALRPSRNQALLLWALPCRGWGAARQAGARASLGFSRPGGGGWAQAQDAVAGLWAVTCRRSWLGQLAQPPSFPLTVMCTAVTTQPEAHVRVAFGPCARARLRSPRLKPPVPFLWPLGAEASALSSARRAAGTPVALARASAVPTFATVGAVPLALARGRPPNADP
jgi:hypothetical protein